MLLRTLVLRSFFTMPMTNFLYACFRVRGDQNMWRLLVRAIFLHLLVGPGALAVVSLGWVDQSAVTIPDDYG